MSTIKYNYNNVVKRQIYLFRASLCHYQGVRSRRKQSFNFSPSPVCSKRLFKSSTIIVHAGDCERFQRLSYALALPDEGTMGPETCRS